MFTLGEDSKAPRNRHAHRPDVGAARHRRASVWAVVVVALNAVVACSREQSVDQSATDSAASTRGDATESDATPREDLPFGEPVVEGCQDLGAKPVRPIALRGKIFATYLPDGKRYTKLRPSSPPDPFEVGILDLDRPGTSIQRLTRDDVHDAEIVVSPDGAKMVWTVRRNLDFFDGENTIMLADVGVSNKKVLAHEAAYLGIPSFVLPAADKVMFSAQGEADAFAKLVFVDIASGARTELQTDFRGSISDPQMSRDGTKIVFKSFEQADTDDAQLYIMNADGTGVRRLITSDTKDEDPAFSPDGRTIAFERMYGDTEHKGNDPRDVYFQEGIVSLDLATGQEFPLTEPDPCGKNELWLPTWSPDGEFIMFTRGLHLETGEFTHDLWVMRKDGSDLQRVPNSDGIMFFDWVY